MKRIIDLLLACLGFVILSPILIITALLIRLKMGDPVIFTQTRSGLDGKPFRMLKFRTMHDMIGPDGKPLPDKERLSPFGRSMRSMSIDELPELWNIIKGDMSIVGPRPLLMEYLPLYDDEQARRHEIKPGLTGWAQVNGRNALSWKEKFEHDVWYVDNRTIWLDFKIIWLTVKNIILRKGISAEGEATMPKFIGNL